MKIIFISSLDTSEFREMHTKSNNIEVMSGTETCDAINEIFKSFLKRYQEGLETKMKGSSFTFDRLDLLEYHLHQISLNKGSSCIKSSDWLKNKGATIIPKNTEDNECFKYAITTALHHQEIGRNPQRISKLRPFINNYDWKDMEFPSHSKDWRKFEQNNKAIALNILFVTYNTKQIRAAYVSKHNDERDNQVNLLMITNNDKDWHYLAVKSISGLLKEIISTHNGDFFFWSTVFTRTQQKKNLKSMERYAKTMISAM